MAPVDVFSTVAATEDTAMTDVFAAGAVGELTEGEEHPATSEDIRAPATSRTFIFLPFA